jgi:hypothetical protein
MKPARPPLFDVVTIGAATRDTFVRSSHFENIPSDSAPDGYNACLPMGAKIPIDDMSFHTGGGATNTAVTFRRFGCKTSCVTRIGKDVGGTEILNLLKRERIDTRGIETDTKDATGYSIILLSGAGHRAILTSRGACAHLERNKIDWSTLSSSWIYLTSIGGNEKILKEIFAHAKKSLTRIAWNPGSAELELGLKHLQTFFLHTDVLIFNREEAAMVANCSPRDLEYIFHTLGPLPRQALIITDGAHGAYAYARGLAWHAPAIPGKIKNTTGAGDAFSSATVASLLKNGDLTHALQVGTLNAASVVRHMGATTGILTSLPTATSCSRVRIRQI